MALVLMMRNVFFFFLSLFFGRRSNFFDANMQPQIVYCWRVLAMRGKYDDFVFLLYLECGTHLTHKKKCVRQRIEENRTKNRTTQTNGTINFLHLEYFAAFPLQPLLLRSRQYEMFIFFFIEIVVCGFGCTEEIKQIWCIKTFVMNT